VDPHGVDGNLDLVAQLHAGTRRERGDEAGGVGVVGDLLGAGVPLQRAYVLDIDAADTRGMWAQLFEQIAEPPAPSDRYTVDAPFRAAKPAAGASPSRPLAYR
jgi:hypothetical protein